MITKVVKNVGTIEVAHADVTAIGDDGTVTMHGVGITASDGYHTFDELYEHRHALFLALCKILFTSDEFDRPVWCSKLHHDGTMFDGWFVIGIGYVAGEQISYHLPLKHWDDAINWAVILEHAPEWDGHTSNDVLERLRKL